MRSLNPTIQAGGYLLRQPVPTDASDLTRSLGDTETSRFPASTRRPLTDGWALEWISSSNLDTGSGGPANYVISDPSTGELIGAAVLSRVIQDRRQAELSYWTAPWARGRGAAKSAVTALANAAFEAGLERLETLAEWGNLAAQRVALATGFHREGVRRNAARTGTGERYDLVVYARCAGDPPGPVPRLIPDLPGGRLSDGVVLLRPLLASDAEDYFRIESLPEVIASSVGAPATREDAERVCERSYSQWLAGGRADVVILDALTGAFAGNLGFYYLEPMTGMGIIGYSLMPEYRGRGFATRSVNLIAEWLFADVGIERLIAGTEPGNVASQRVLERAGFTREAFLKSRLPGSDGGRIDDIQFVRFPPGS